MQNKKLQAVFIVLFCAYIGIFGLLYILLPKADFSEKEKRVLTGFPELSAASVLDGSFESGFETWMSDHVPARDVLVGMNARYDLLSGRNGLNGVIHAGDGRLFASAEKLDGEAVVRKCERINAFFENTGLPVDVLLVPTSGYMYQDELPMHAPYRDGEMAQLVRQSLNGEIGFIWPEDALRALAGEKLYYNTDHHLTSRGSYEIYSLYAESLGLPVPEVQDYEIESFDGFHGSMYAKAGLWDVKADGLEIWRGPVSKDVRVSFDDREDSDTLFFTDHLQEMDKYPVFLDGNHGLVIIESGRSQGENLLLVRDSFGHCFAPFAADGFSRIVLVDLRYYRKSVSELAREMDIDRALFLYGADTFLTDTNFAWLK